MTEFETELTVIEGACGNGGNKTAICYSELYDFNCERGFGSTIEWKTEKDQDYIVYVGGSQKDAGGTNFELVMDKFDWVDPMVHCEAELEIIEARSDE